MSFGEFQRGERVGGLSGLRYKQRSPDCRNRAARYVAKFGRDIDFHREPCVTFEPVPGNQPGVKGGATGRDRHSIDIPKIQFHDFRYVDRAAGDINASAMEVTPAKTMNDLFMAFSLSVLAQVYAAA